MINSNMMNMLNDIAFGADLDSLESYLIDYAKADSVADLSLYNPNYTRMFKIMQEIRTSSLAISNSIKLQAIDIDEELDQRFTETYNPHIGMVYGVSSAKMKPFRNTLDARNEDPFDIIALRNIKGLDLKAVYKDGNLEKIHLIGGKHKYMDITELLERYALLPDTLQELEDYEVVELRGKVTLNNAFKDLQDKSLNVECAAMHCLRTETNIEKLSIVMNDILLDNFTYEDMPFHNQWDKMDYLEDLGFEVPEYSLARGVYEDSLSSMLLSFNEYFSDVEKQKGVKYNHNGLELRLNSKLKCYDQESKLLYNPDDCSNNSFFTTTIKSLNMRYKNNRLILSASIVPMKCNDNLTIDTVDIDDLYMAEEHNLKVGSKLQFAVAERKAIPYFGNTK